MAYEAKDGSGALFANDKQGNARRPDWRGDVTIEGKKYRLSGWAKQSSRGEFISLKAEPWQEAERTPRAPPTTPSAGKRPDGRYRDETYRAGAEFDDNTPPF